MKKLLLILPIFLFAFNFKQEYVNRNFTKICKYGLLHFKDIKQNEDILSLVGFSCVKSDYFIYLPKIINNLKFSKRARNNSIYFSTLFLEKKLLIAYIIDGTNISYYKFPNINHPVSIVINHILNNNFTKENGIVTVKNDDKVYKVYKTPQDKVFIDIYINGELIKSHWYR